MNRVKSGYGVRLIATAVGMASLATFGVIAFEHVGAKAANSYVNPLSALGGVQPERIDQGVDYYSSGGNILAIGDGTVTYAKSSGSGWNPGGAFIEYKFTDGPAMNYSVYVAECINLLVTSGTVTAGQAIASINTNCAYGPECAQFCIETGWACLTALGSAEAGQYCTNQDQGNYTVATAYGCNFNAMLVWLGAPSGTSSCAQPLNNPPIPSTWPTWPPGGGSAPATGLMVAENSSYTWVAHGTRLEKFNLGGYGANLFSTSTTGTTGPDALGYFDFGANVTAIAVNESYLYIGLSTGRVIKTTMCGQGYNPCQFSDNMGGFTMPGYSYWIGVQDYSLGAVSALAVNSSYLFSSLGSRTVKTGLCTSGGSMCWANSSGTGPISGGGGQYYGYQDWSAPVIAQAANDSYVFTSMYGNGLTRVCKTGLGSSGSDVFALSSGACTGNYPGYSDWIGYQDMSTPVVGLAADPVHVFWSLGNPARLVQTNMCSSGGNVCAFSDGYGSGSIAGYADWIGRQDGCSGYQAASVTSSLANRSQNPWADWAFSTGGGMSRIVQAYPGTGYNMFATGDCTATSPYPGYNYWVGYQDLSI